MANQVFTPNSQDKLDLAALVAMSAPWNGGLIALFKNAVTLSKQSLFADFQQCDFTGYATSSAVVWGTPFYLPTGLACVVSDLKTFTVGSSPTVFNTVYGWMLVNAGNTDWIMARLFDTPINLFEAGQSIQVLASNPFYQTP